MASEAENLESSTETIIHKLSSVEEPNKHLETVLKHYEAENVKESIEGDNIDKLPSVGKASDEKLLSSSSAPNSTVGIGENSMGSESYGEDTEEPVSKSLAVKEPEGQLPKSSDGKETKAHLVEKGDLNSSKEIPIMTEETVGEECQSHNRGTYQDAEVNESELKEDSKVEKLSSASIMLDSTEKIASIEHVTFEDHTSRISPQEGSFHIITSEEAKKELPMISSSEDLHSNLKEMESGDTKEETTNNGKTCSDAGESVTAISDNLSALSKEEAENGEEINACLGTELAVAPTEETCETGSRSEAVVSNTHIKEIVSVVGQSETEEKERNTEINLSETPKEASKDDSNDPSSTKEKQTVDEKNVLAVDLNEEDGIHLYATAKGRKDAPTLDHETEASEGTQLPVEEPKVIHYTDEADQKLDSSSDLRMPLTEEAPIMDLAPPCQINANDLETESTLLADDFNKEDEIHLNYTAKGQEDAPCLVRETEASEGTQLSVEDKKAMHKIDESDQKLDSSDPEMPLTEGASGIDLAPPCQNHAANLETESSSMKNDLNEEGKIHIYDKTNGQQDSSSLVHEIEVSEGTQLSIEEPKVMHNTDETDRKLDSSDIQHPLPEGASDTDLAPPCHIDADNLEIQSSMVENYLNKEDEIHLNDTGKGELETPPLVHEIEGSEGSQLSVEEPKVMHDTNVTDRKLDSSDIRHSLPEGASDMDLVPPCHINADNLETESSMTENDLNKENKIHLNDTGKGELETPPLIREIEGSEGTQLSAEEPKDMHNSDETDRKLDSSDIRHPLPEGASDMGLAPPCHIDADNLETESRMIENDLNNEDTIHLNDMGKGEQETPPLVHGLECSEGTQPSVEEPKVMHHIDEADRKLDCSVLGLSPTEGAPETDLAQPCQTDADNLDTGLNMDSREESVIMETNIEEELEQVADSLVESHNLTTANDANSKVIKEETEFDSSNNPLSEDKSDELKVQQSEPSKAPQTYELTDQRLEERVMSDNIDQNSKLEEHGETDTTKTEAEEINTLSYSTLLTTEESKETNDVAATGCDGTDFSSPKEESLITANNKVFSETTSVAEPEEHSESVLKLYEAENIKASNTESTNSENVEEFPSVDKVQSEKLQSSQSELSHGSEPGSRKEQISESLEGKEIQGQVIESLDKKEIEARAVETSDGKETEGCGLKSSDEKETQEYHVDEGGYNSTQEIQTNIKEIIGQGYNGPNGGIAKEETDVDIPAVNSHQSEEVEVSELTGESNIKNMTKCIVLDNTEKIIGVGSLTLEDQLSRPSIKEDSTDAISSSMTKNELFVPSASEDILANVEVVESRAIEEAIINNEKIGLDANVNVACSPLSAPPDTPIEETCFTSLGSEADVASFDTKGITSLDEQNETEEIARATKINLPDVHTESRRDETNDAGGSQENQPFGDKSILADDFKEDDKTNKYDTTKGQQAAPSLIHETEVCEENQISAEESDEIHKINEANKMPHSSNLELSPTEGASNMDMISHSQIDAEKAEPEIVSPQELHISAESITKDKLQQNDPDIKTIEEEPHLHSSSTMPTVRMTDELVIQEKEYRHDTQMELLSEAKEELGDEKEEDTNETTQNSELQGHEETDISKTEDEESMIITDKEQIVQVYPEKLTTEELKKTNEEAASECENTNFNSPNKEEGTKDELLAASVEEKDLPDSLATLEEDIKASIEEDKENGSQIKEDQCDQVIKSSEISADEDKLERSYAEDKGKEEVVVISQTSKTDDSCKEMAAISDLDLKEHGDMTYLAKQASSEELPTISSTVIKEHSNSSNLETHVTNGSFERMEDQGMKSDEHRIDETPCENVEVMHENFTNESSQVPEYIEKSDHIIQTPENIEEDCTPNELHTVFEEHIPSHEVKDVGLATLQGIDTIDSNDTVEEVLVLLAEDSRTEEDRSIIEAPEEVKEATEQVEGMKSISLQNVEKDQDEKSEGRVPQLAENFNTEQDSPTTEVAHETTRDKELVQDMSSVSLQNIDTIDLDEKSEDKVVQLAENSTTEQESSTTEVPKETTGDHMHIQDMTNMILEKPEEAFSHNFVMEAGDSTDKADALVKKESSLEDVHNDEKTFHVYTTDMGSKEPLRTTSSCEKVAEVETEQLEKTSGSVYQTEPSETKEIISEILEMETPNEQEDNEDEGQQNHKDVEEKSGIIHSNNDDVEDGHTTSSQKKPEATIELQETCGVQHREEKEPETLDSIKETIHEGEIAVVVSSMATSEEECLLENDSDAPELKKASVEMMCDQSRLKEENIHKENSGDTTAEMSSLDPNCLASESSMKDVDNYSMSNVTVMIEEFQESNEATDVTSHILPKVLDTEAKLHHADVPGESVEGGIKEGALFTEGAINILKEEMTETGLEDNISREKVNNEDSNDLEREAVPEEPQIIRIEEMPETTKKESNNEKVSTSDMDIIQSGKDREDEEHEKPFIGNLESEKRSITGDFPEMDTADSNEVGENSEFLAEGHKPAEGSSIETSEEIRRNIIPDATNEDNEDQVISAATISDIKVNEVAEQHGITEGGHSKVQDPSNEKFKEDYIDIKDVQILDRPLPDVSVVNVLEDIETMPESLKTTDQAEMQKQQTADDSNVVPEVTNLDSELQCTSDESKTIEQESTTIRPVNGTTLVLTQGPRDNNLSDVDKGESLAQLSTAHDDYVIKDVAEKEDTLEIETRNNEKIEIKNTSNLPVSSDKDPEEIDSGETKPTICSKDKDIPLLESGSTMVTDLEDVKQVYPCEAVPEPHSTINAENRDSHDQKETPDSTKTVSDHVQEFTEENVLLGDTDSQDQHEDSHVIQNVQDSSMISQEASINVVESTHQTAELPLASLSTSESLLTPEVGPLIVSSPKDCKDVSEMQEEIEAQGNRIMDEPVKTTGEFLPAEISEDSTLEQADHPGEINKLKTQPAGGEAKPDNAKLEEEEPVQQKEGSSGSEVVFIGEKDPNDEAKGEKDEHNEHKEGYPGSEVAFISAKNFDEEAKVEKEENSEQKEGSSGSEVASIDKKDLDEDDTVEKEEHREHKEGNSGSEVAFVGETNPDEEAKVEKEEDAEQKEGSSGSEVASIGKKNLDEDAKVENEENGEHNEGRSGSEVASIDKKDLNEDTKVEKEEHGEHKEGSSGSEVAFIGQKYPDEENGEQKEGSSGSEVAFIDKKDLDEDDKVEKEEHCGHKECNSGFEVAFIGETYPDEEAKVKKEEDGAQVEGSSGSEVAFIGKKDLDEDAKVEKEENGEHNEGSSGSEVASIDKKYSDEESKVEKEDQGEHKDNSGSEVLIGEKDPADNSDKIIAAEVKNMSSIIVSNDIILVQVDQEEGTETLINKEGSRVKAVEATDEEEQVVQKENRLGPEEPINDEKCSDYDTSNKIIAGEMDGRSNMIMSERSLSGHSEEHMEAVSFSKDKEVKTDQTKVEGEEQDVWKGNEPVSEALLVSEKDEDAHTIDMSIVAQMKDGTPSATPDDIILVEECQEDQREKKKYIEDKEANADQYETVQKQDVPKESNPEAEVPLTNEKDSYHHTSNIIPVIEMKDKSLKAEPDLVQEYPGADTETVIFSGDKEVQAGCAEVATRDQDGVKEEKLESEVAGTSEKDRVDYMVSVKDNSNDFIATVTHREDKSVKPDSKSGITDAEIEKPLHLNTSEVVPEPEKCESAGERISSHDYQEMHEVLESTLPPKSSPTNQRQDSEEEPKLNAAEMESPTPDNLHALPHITNLSTETITKADESGMNTKKKEIPPLEAEQYMVVEADLKVTQEPESAKNILKQKESAETIQADEKHSELGEQGSVPAYNNNEKTTSNETNKAVAEHFSNEHLSEAKTEDSKAIKSTEHKDKEYEEGKEHEDNTSSDLRIMIEPSRDMEVKVSPKKSHNLLSGVIKHSISKMKKAITCTNSQPMPQSPR